uniref:Ring finger domain protein n=1 Tax=Marseillevirus LCMAC201 TaxID=2506605 RepID=A0A481YWY7_9VIRU|nr:MAG: ring finger domain protein [Marseillevirus LCMAC201]
MYLTELDTETIRGATLKQLGGCRKAALVNCATKLNGSDCLETFEQFSNQIPITRLTIQQLKRYIITMLDNLEREKVLEIGLLIVGETITGNVEKCNVCYELMGRQMNNLPCGHWIHYTCMAKGVDTRCPICRREVLHDLPYGTQQDIAQNKMVDQIRQLTGLQRN